MNEQTEILHQQASEHYLQGDYDAACVAWKRLLDVDPNDDRALEGLRLCSMMMGAEVEPASLECPPATGGDATDPPLPIESTPTGVATGAVTSPGAAAPVGAGPQPASGPQPPPLPTVDRVSPAQATPHQPPPLPDAENGSTDPGATQQLSFQAVTGSSGGAGFAAGESEAIDLDLDLGVLDEMNETPSGQAHGVPFGDQEDVESMLIDREDASIVDPGSSEVTETLSVAVDQVIRQTAAAAGKPGQAVEPAAATPSADASATDAAEDELRRRIGELLHEAQRASDEGKTDEALTLISRVFILDEKNLDARALEESIRGRQAKEAHDIEDLVAEAVQWLENDRVEDAAARFRELLERQPDHQEVLHYLEEAEHRLAQGGQTPDPDELGVAGSEHVPIAPGEDASIPEDEFLVDGLSSEPDPTSVQDHGAVALEDDGGGSLGLADAAAPIRPAVIPEDRSPARDAADEPDAPVHPPARRRSSPIILGAGAVFIAVAGVYFGTDLFREGRSQQAAEISPATAEAIEHRDGATPAGGNRSTEELVQQADALSGIQGMREIRDDDVENQIRAAMDRGNLAMDAGKYGEAVIAFNKAVELAPDNAEAAAGLLEAGGQYRDHQAQLEELRRAKRSFDDGDYTTALRALYRLPKDLEPESVARYKANGWYNLGIISLKAGEPAEGIGHFNEALSLRPDDRGAIRARDLAERLRDSTRDARYYAEVEPMKFREADF